jgi:hypothetical protein
MKVRGWFSAIRRRAAAILVAGVLAAPMVSLESASQSCWWRAYHVISNKTYCINGTCYDPQSNGFVERWCTEAWIGATNCGSTSGWIGEDHYNLSGCVTSKCPGASSDLICKGSTFNKPLSTLAYSCEVLLSGECASG